MPDLASFPLGVFDSGVGGLTVLRALTSALPRESFLYLGDTARVPYGSKPLDMVRGFADEIAEALLERCVKGIVIACNTASAASLPHLAERLPVPVWGVIEPGVAAALRATRRTASAPEGDGGARNARAATPRIGVLGTVATVTARVYQDRLEAAGATTWERACPLFVPIVEEGISDSTIARLVAEYYLGDRPSLDAVILGCTHYPALKPVLASVFGPEVHLVDSADAVTETVVADLATMGLARGSAAPGSAAPHVHYLVTGDIDAFLHTARVLGGPAGTAEHVDLTRRHAVAASPRAGAATPGAQA